MQIQFGHTLTIRYWQFLFQSNLPFIISYRRLPRYSKGFWNWIYQRCMLILGNSLPSDALRFTTLVDHMPNCTVDRFVWKAVDMLALVVLTCPVQTKWTKKKFVQLRNSPHIVCRFSEALLLPPNNNKYLIENKNGVLLLNKFNLQLKNVYKWYDTHVWTHRQTNKLNWNLLAATHTQFSLALARFGCNRYNIIFNRLRWHYIEISYTGRRHSASQRHSHTIQIGSFLSMWKNMCLSWYWFDRTIPLHWQSMPTKYSPLCPECRLGWHHTVAVTRT